MLLLLCSPACVLWSPYAFCVLQWFLPGTKQCFIHSRSLISASSLAGHCTDNYPRKALLQKLSKDTQYDNAVHYHTLEYSIPKSPGRNHGVSSAPLISCNSGCTKGRVSVSVSGVHLNCSCSHRFQLPLLTKLLTRALSCQYVPWSPQAPFAYVFLVFTLDTCSKMWSAHTCLQEEASWPANEPRGERDQEGRR